MGVASASLPRAELVAALQPCATVASSRTTIRALTHVRVTASEDGKLTLLACNGEQWVCRVVAAMVGDAFDLLLPARVLMDALKTMQSGDVVLEGHSGSSVRVSGGKARFVIPALDTEDFPEFQTSGVASEIVLTGSALRALQGVNEGSSDEINRPMLRGVHLFAQNGRVVMEATNTHLVLRESVEGEIAGDTIVHRDFVATLAGMGFSDAEEVRIEAYGNVHLVRRGDDWAAHQAIKGDFPMIDRVIPTESLASWTIPKDEFVAALRTVAVTAADNQNRVVLTFLGPDRLVLRARGDVRGEAQIEVSVATDGDFRGPIALNVRYLLLMTQQCPDAGVRLSLTTPSRPVLFTGPDSSHWLGVVMPMNLD